MGDQRTDDDNANLASPTQDIRGRNERVTSDRFIPDDNTSNNASAEQERQTMVVRQNPHD